MNDDVDLGLLRNGCLCLGHVLGSTFMVERCELLIDTWRRRCSIGVGVVGVVGVGRLFYPRGRLVREIIEPDTERIEHVSRSGVWL